MDEGGDDFAEWQKRVEGTNISQTTLLATDYLNHFNEIIMLLGMVPDMPELLEECRAWQPKSYQQHFQDSGFSDKELAIAAYDHVPARYRQPFEDTIGMLNSAIQALLDALQSAADAGEEDLLRARADAAARVLQKLLDHASAIIHGSQHTMNQGEIDALLAV